MCTHIDEKNDDDEIYFCVVHQISKGIIFLFFYYSTQHFLFVIFYLIQNYTILTKIIYNFVEFYMDLVCC